MYMKETDADDHIFVRVTGINGDYKIHGWITGREGKEFPLQDKYNRGFQSRCALRSASPSSTAGVTMDALMLLCVLAAIIVFA